MRRIKTFVLQTRRHRFLIALGGITADKAPALINAISYPDESGLRKPDSLHFFRIVKEQPKNLKLTAKRALGGASR